MEKSNSDFQSISVPKKSQHQLQLPVEVQGFPLRSITLNEGRLFCNSGLEYSVVLYLSKTKPFELEKTWEKAKFQKHSVLNNELQHKDHWSPLGWKPPFVAEKDNLKYSVYDTKLRKMFEIYPFNKEAIKSLKLKMKRFSPVNRIHIYQFDLTVNMLRPLWKRGAFVENSRIVNLRNRKILVRLRKRDCKYESSTGTQSINLLLTNKSPVKLNTLEDKFYQIKWYKQLNKIDRDHEINGVQFKNRVHFIECLSDSWKHSIYRPKLRKMVMDTFHINMLQQYKCEINFFTKCQLCLLDEAENLQFAEIINQKVQHLIDIEQSVVDRRKNVLHQYKWYLINNGAGEEFLMAVGKDFRYYSAYHQKNTPPRNMFIYIFKPNEILSEFKLVKIQNTGILIDDNFHISKVIGDSLVIHSLSNTIIVARLNDNLDCIMVDKVEDAKLRADLVESFDYVPQWDAYGYFIHDFEEDKSKLQFIQYHNFK